MDAAGSTHEVAQRAGVGIGTVFRHFPTKGELVEAVLISHFARVTDQARSLAAASPPGSALRTLVREMIETGPTKVTLASLAGGREQLSPPFWRHLGNCVVLSMWCCAVRRMPGRLAVRPLSTRSTSSCAAFLTPHARDVPGVRLIHEGEQALLTAGRSEC